MAMLKTAHTDIIHIARISPSWINIYKFNWTLRITSDLASQIIIQSPKQSCNCCLYRQGNGANLAYKNLILQDILVHVVKKCGELQVKVKLK